MEKDGQKNVVNHFAAGSNCQVFNGNITGCVFAMPGATVTQQPVQQVGNTASEQSPKEVSAERLARAIENCQQYFWGNSAYAVVFCICRDAYKMQPNKTAFEKMVEQLPYKGRRDYKCPLGTIANAFSDNLIFNENIHEWDQFNPLPRIVKLRDELRRELKL
jgi:hypothetical protein